MFRGMLLLLGVLGSIWPASVISSFRVTSPAREIAARIMADQRFKPGLLANIFASMKEAPVTRLQPELLQAEALVALRASEEAVRVGAAEADRDVEEAEDRIKASLSVSPSDAFLWLSLYSVETVRQGLDTKSLIYLDQSYASGPNEGWVALRRNRLALAALPLLSDRSQENVISEFVAIVNSDWIEDAAQNLLGVGWRHRERLAKNLEKADLESRQLLARRLSIEGVTIDIPGVQIGDRPWR